ncbi:MAG: hypothetical protein AAFX02_03030 [Pseudomonadota bacterium]
MSSPTNSVVPLWEDAPAEDTRVGGELVATGEAANDADIREIVESRPPSRLFSSLKWLALIILIFAYPVSVLASHKISDKPIVLEDGVWASTDIGIVSTLVSRELNQVGWAEDQAIWHPQARLTALPAWQEGIISASSPWIQAVAVSTGNDSDLLAASRLLTPTGELPTTPRLKAALEALERYDSRLEGNFASAISSDQYVELSLDQSLVIAETARAKLRAALDNTSVWPATNQSIEAYFEAKAAAFVTYMRLTTMASSDVFSSSSDAALALETATERWEKAARQKPLFVMNQSGDGILAANHLAVMSFYLEDARRATEALIDRTVDAETRDSDGSQTVESGSAP